MSVYSVVKRIPRTLARSRPLPTAASLACRDHPPPQEASMMAALRHPNVVAFLGVCTAPPCVATEYCGRGSLTDVLRGGRASPAKAKQLDWARRLNMVGGCCSKRGLS